MTYHDLEIFVLDEADRMLDMGFIHDVRKINRLLPRHHQTLLFSATIPPTIRNLAREILVNPVEVSVEAKSPTVKLINQSICFVEKPDKRNLLTYLFENPDLERVLIFTRTKLAGGGTLPGIG